MNRPISKAKASQLARRARRYGYNDGDPDRRYRPGSGEPVYVYCPLCKRRVTGLVVIGLPDGGDTINQALDRAVIEHLTTTTDDQRCPQAREATTR